MENYFSELHFWHWLILGVICLMFELTSGSGFLLWPAIAGFLISLLTYLIPSMYWPWQVVLFSCFSVVSSVLWWKYLKICTETSDKPNLNKRTTNFIGRTFELKEAIENGRGRVKIGDTYWLVEGDDQVVNTKVKVTSVDGVMLHVEKV
jgi:membrane protein implicated in regulation of membrane protease activity